MSVSVSFKTRIRIGLESSRMQSGADMCLANATGAPELEVTRLDRHRNPHPSLRRVLYVVSQFPSWSETFIVREIRALLDEGVDVRILSLKHPSGELVHADAAALIDRVHHPPRMPAMLANALRAWCAHPLRISAATATVVAGTWRNPTVLLKSLATLARSLGQLPWLREFDPEFIHAHWSTYPATAAWMLARVMQRPFGFTCHAHDVFVNQQLLARKIADAALAVTISRHNVEWLDRNVTGLAQSKMEVVHCGVDLAGIPWRPDGRTGHLVLGVGRLVEMKGFGTLIEALALLRAHGVEFRCLIAGEGPERTALQASVFAHGLQDQVELPGAMAQERIRAALDEAAVFALPCEIAADGSRDGIPVALMEAMAAGCPVVSCPVSGVPELIRDGEHGLLVPPHDPQALANALRRLLGDASLRRHLAIAARRRIELDFDAREEACKLHQLMARATADAA
jgi:glycosyltransferase involved in cell wall biosynthesis